MTEATVEIAAFHDASAAGKVLASLVPDQEARAVAEIFQLLADPTRVRLIAALRHADLCVSDLAQIMGLTESAISHQMRDLRLRRLVSSRRDGRHVYYSLKDHHVRHLLEDTLKHVKE